MEDNERQWGKPSLEESGSAPHSLEKLIYNNYNHETPLLPCFMMLHLILLKISPNLSSLDCERHGSAMEKQKTFYAQFSLD